MNRREFAAQFFPMMSLAVAAASGVVATVADAPAPAPRKLPPLHILVSGGSLTPEAAERIAQFMLNCGVPSNRSQALVVDCPER